MREETDGGGAPGGEPDALPSGRLEAIWLKRVRRGPMDAVERATLVTGRGLEGNANQGGSRQVTVIEREVFDALSDALEREVAPDIRRANLMVSGLPLGGSRNRVLRVGSCRIELRGETRPCERMDEAVPGLRHAMEPGGAGGVFGRVLEGGAIAVGDPVWLEDPGEPSAPQAP